MAERTKIGFVGCGDVLDMYMSSAKAFPGLHVAAVTDKNPISLKARSEQFSIPAMSFEDLLARADIEFLVNLTPPRAHFETTTAMLAAGKHVYSEKPLGVTLGEAQTLIETAKRYGRTLGSAPDTLLGAGHRLAQTLLRDGAIGQIVSASAVFMTHGMEHWHPAPHNYFQPGGGPVFDIGPYYVGALVRMLGNVAKVSAVSHIGFRERVVAAEGPNHGQVIAVGTPTTYHALLVFSSGVKASLTMSWDVWHHGRGPEIEVYGTEGTLVVPDPNMFGGVNIQRHPDGHETAFDSGEMPLGAPHWRVKEKYRLSEAKLLSNYRMAGAADLVDAVKTGREPFASPSLALHVIDVIESIIRSAEEQRFVELSTATLPLPPGPTEADIARIVAAP